MNDDKVKRLVMKALDAIEKDATRTRARLISGNLSRAEWCGEILRLNNRIASELSTRISGAIITIEEEL